jgi:hypothetical protein
LFVSQSSFSSQRFLRFLTKYVARMVAVAQLHLDAVSVLHGQVGGDRQVEFLAATVEDLSVAGACSFPNYVLALVCALVGRLASLTLRDTHALSTCCDSKSDSRLK